MGKRGQKDDSVLEVTSSEELCAAKNILNALLKAKKIIKIYPPDNPVYNGTVHELLEKFNDVHQYTNELKIIIGHNQIIYDGEPVYDNPTKSDNLALLFFKDGLRELRFQKDISYEEIEEFLKIINIDFNRDKLDDDIVTMLWERDFHNIHYVVDENYLSDEADYESAALKYLQEKPSSPGSYKNAHDNFIRKGELVTDISIDLLLDENLKVLLDELEKDRTRKASKIVNILFEVLYEVDKEDDYTSLSNYFNVVIEYLVNKGFFREVVNLQVKLHESVQIEIDAKRKCTESILKLIGSYEMLKLIGSSLDSGSIIEKGDYDEYISYLDTSSILPLMNILAELQTIHARKMFIDALVYLAKNNSSQLYPGLNDSRWYVVRNTIHILRKIGCSEAMSHIVLTVKHENIRVRKESIRFIGELGSDSIVPVLQKLLKDLDVRIRSESLQALKKIASDRARKVLIEEISNKHFNEKEFNEKKTFFEVLATCNGSDVYDFLTEILNRKSFMKGAKYYELKSCAVHCLGLLGVRSALTLLDSFNSSDNRLLREYTNKAIKRIENG